MGRASSRARRAGAGAAAYLAERETHLAAPSIRVPDSVVERPQLSVGDDLAPSLGRRWQVLHRLVYFSALAACLHFIWKVKVVIGEPIYYAAILAALLGFMSMARHAPQKKTMTRPTPATVST